MLVCCDLALALRALGYFCLRFRFSCSCQSSSYGKHIRTLLDIAAPLWNGRMSLVLAGNNFLSVCQHTEAFISVLSLKYSKNMQSDKCNVRSTKKQSLNGICTRIRADFKHQKNIVFSGFGAEHRTQCIWTVLTRIIYLNIFCPIEVTCSFDYYYCYYWLTRINARIYFRTCNFQSKIVPLLFATIYFPYAAVHSFIRPISLLSQTACNLNAIFAIGNCFSLYLGTFRVSFYQLHLKPI